MSHKISHFHHNQLLLENPRFIDQLWLSILYFFHSLIFYHNFCYLI